MKKIVISMLIVFTIILSCNSIFAMKHYEEVDFVTGMVTASALNVRTGPSTRYRVIGTVYKNEYITYSYYRLSLELLEKYGFKKLKKQYEPKKLLEIMQKDKKAANGKITFIVPVEKKKVKELKLTQPEVLNMFDCV